MKAMKAKTSMKAMKTKKAKRVSKIATGPRAKVAVFLGRKEKTKGGLTREMLMRNKRGKIVSKRSSAAGKKHYGNIKAWTEACVKARSTLNLKGFVAINGKSLVGKAMYVKAKALTQLGRTGSAAAQPDGGAQ